MELKEKLDNLPAKSGVYLFRDDLGRIIYVGKATNLRSRVRSYFQAGSKGESMRRMWLRRSIADLDYIVVSTPVEALVLEANLIKRYRPAYNVRMKDDKRYPCIEMTMGEDFPRLRIVRRPDNKKSRYFGPYTVSRAMRRTFKLVQKAFLIRTCKYDIDKPLDRPCLDYHINICAGPCIRAVSTEEYGRMVQRACDFLDGRSDDLLKAIRNEIDVCSENLEFERCIYLRDLVEAIEHVTARRPVMSQPGDDADFIACYSDGKKAALVIMQVRDGKLLGQHKHVYDKYVNVEEDEIIYRFIQSHYKPGFFIPGLICISADIAGKKELEEWLEDMRGHRVEIRQPKRGERRKIVELAWSNAQEHLEIKMKVSRERSERNAEALEDLRKTLGLEEIPRRIEGYDISNISGTLSVASMVVFTDGEPHKDHYRRFKIRQGDGPDDFAMIFEALDRRLRNLKLGELESFRERPDLILIDGGKGQLHAALDAAKKQNVSGLNIISIAKKEEEIFIPGKSLSLATDALDPGIKLLRRVRDEAHRFAVTYHRTLRSKKIEVSILDEIKGISKKRKETLLRNFDSIDDISKASLYELEQLPGFNRKVAEEVLRFLGAGNDPSEKSEKRI